MNPAEESLKKIQTLVDDLGVPHRLVAEYFGYTSSMSNVDVKGSPLPPTPDILSALDDQDWRYFFSNQGLFVDSSPYTIAAKKYFGIPFTPVERDLVSSMRAEGLCSFSPGVTDPIPDLTVQVGKVGTSHILCATIAAIDVCRRLASGKGGAIIVHAPAKANGTLPRPGHSEVEEMFDHIDERIERISLTVEKKGMGKLDVTPRICTFDALDFDPKNIRHTYHFGTTTVEILIVGHIDVRSLRNKAGEPVVDLFFKAYPNAGDVSVIFDSVPMTSKIPSFKRSQDALTNPFWVFTKKNNPHMGVYFESFGNKKAISIPSLGDKKTTPEDLFNLRGIRL